MPVAVQSLAPQPLPVSDAFAVQHGVNLNGYVYLGPGGRGSSEFVYGTAGQYLIVGQIAAHGFVPPGQKLIASVQVSVIGNPAPIVYDYYLVLTDEGGGFIQDSRDGTSQVSEVFRASERSRIYLPPHSQISVVGLRNDVAGVGEVYFTISGHLLWPP